MKSEFKKDQKESQELGVPVWKPNASMQKQVANDLMKGLEKMGIDPNDPMFAMWKVKANS